MSSGEGDSGEKDIVPAPINTFSSQQMRDSLAAAGRTLVRQKYGWPAIRREFGAQVRDAVERRRLPASPFSGEAPLPVS